MKIVELNYMKALFQRELQRLEAIKVSCNECLYFAQGKCSKFDATPPPEFQKAGCDEWEWDSVPF